MTVPKTKVLSCTRKNGSLLLQYSVQDVTLPQTSMTADLVLFGGQLTFTPHVNFIKLQALSYVGTLQERILCFKVFNETVLYCLSPVL